MAEVKQLPSYSKNEELINVITHAAGTAISCMAAIAMIVLAGIKGNVSNIIGSIVFGFGLIWLYSMSTVYHNERNLEKRVLRQKFDHLSINILIAASNTFYLTALENTVGYVLTGVIWSLSILAMILNSINVKKFRVITMVIYILTGWMSIFIMNIVYTTLGLGVVICLLVGGLSYTFGTIFYGIKKTYMHAVWHFMVLGGSIAHIIGAIAFVLI